MKNNSDKKSKMNSTREIGAEKEELAKTKGIGDALAEKIIEVLTKEGLK